jgi:4-hydroxy-3-methylbut-2-enyl diphosphate reductase
VPDSLVLGVLAWLADRGFDAVEEIEAVRETLTFALPPELRRDIKAHAEG